MVYCTTSCQKSAWKNGHKRECKAYKIEIHPEYGRYLVATRELKPGSRILCKLQPAVVGPPLMTGVGVPISELKLLNISNFANIQICRVFC